MKPINHAKISDQVFERIRDMIYRGQLKGGERLMPERELAKALSVGRPTVREAIQKLNHLGIIERRRGAGTFVRGGVSRPENKLFFQFMNEQEFSMIGLLEVRVALECNSAVLAARRATEEDLLLLEDSFNLFRKESDHPERLIENDISFHMNIAYATKNKVQIHLMKNIYDLLFYGMNRVFPTIIQDRQLHEDLIEYHFKILDAIKRHDPKRALEFMEKHMLGIMNICRQKSL